MAKENITYQYNIAQAFAAAFGVGQIPVQYKLPEGDDNGAPNVIYSSLGQINQEEITNGKSWLGLPIHFKFSLAGGTYNAYDLAGNIEQRELAAFQMPLTTMVEFSRAKNIKTTATLGGYGTVKEMYGFQDWSIRIRGICVNDKAHPQFELATDQRNAIAAFEDLADAIQLVPSTNVFTDLGIYALVINSIDLPSVAGKNNYLPFTLNCVSDTPTELIL